MKPNDDDHIGNHGEVNDHQLSNCEEIEFVKTGNPRVLFKPLEALGKSNVFKCLNNVTREIMTLKITDLEEVGNAHQWDDLMSEIAIMANCRCTYVLSYFRSYVVNDMLWLTTEYLGTGSLDILLKLEKISLNQKRVVLRDVTRGLGYLHANGIIHRDIKPRNILVSEIGEVKLINFGVAAKLEDWQQWKHSLCGTPLYMAPEVILQQDYSFEIDIWSLGIMAIEMLIGTAPYHNLSPLDAMLQIAQNEPPRLTGDFDSDFKSFVHFCLRRDPSARPTAFSLLNHPCISLDLESTVLIDLIDYYHQWQAANLWNRASTNRRRSIGFERFQEYPQVEIDHHEDFWDFQTPAASSPARSASEINDLSSASLLTVDSSFSRDAVGSSVSLMPTIPAEGEENERIEGGESTSQATLTEKKKSKKKHDKKKHDKKKRSKRDKEKGSRRSKNKKNKESNHDDGSTMNLEKSASLSSSKKVKILESKSSNSLSLDIEEKPKRRRKSSTLPELSELDSPRTPKSKPKSKKRHYRSVETLGSLSAPSLRSENLLEKSANAFHSSPELIKSNPSSPEMPETPTLTTPSSSSSKKKAVSGTSSERIQDFVLSSPIPQPSSPTPLVSPTSVYSTKKIESLSISKIDGPILRKKEIIRNSKSLQSFDEPASNNSSMKKGKSEPNFIAKPLKQLLKEDERMVGTKRSKSVYFSATAEVADDIKQNRSKSNPIGMSISADEILMRQRLILHQRRERLTKQGFTSPSDADFDFELDFKFEEELNRFHSLDEYSTPQRSIGSGSSGDLLTNNGNNNRSTSGNNLYSTSMISNNTRYHSNLRNNSTTSTDMVDERGWRICKATYAYQARRPSELSFVSGTVIKINEQKTFERGTWVEAEVNGRIGIVPMAFIRPSLSNTQTDVPNIPKESRSKWGPLSAMFQAIRNRLMFLR